MRRQLLRLYAAMLLLAAAGAQSAVINNTAATITYNDNQSFGSFSSSSESSFFPGTTFGNVTFNAVPNVDSTFGPANATSFIFLTLKAAPGYTFTGVGFNETGSWATSGFGSAKVSAQGGIFDAKTGTQLDSSSIFVSQDTSISGNSLAAGTWSMSDSFFTNPPTSLAPNEITIGIARTLTAAGDPFSGGSGIIGNNQSPFFSGIGLNIFYTAQLIPEPATYMMSAAGLLLVLVMRLKRQSVARV